MNKTGSNCRAKCCFGIKINPLPARKGHLPPAKAIIAKDRRAMEDIQGGGDRGMGSDKWTVGSG